MISVHSSVQEVEKSYSDLHLSETTEESESISDKLSESGSLPGNHQSVSRPSSVKASASMEISEKGSKTEDTNLSGASCEPTVPLQGGAGGPGKANLMSKMMMMMMSGGENRMPGMSAVPEPSVPDMMSMLKSGGMPFSDMMAMSKGGMPAMMSKGASPMEMATIFDCIIDMSLARADSDNSDDEEDGATDELPCQYCCRFFSSQMTLKTHILVAHEQEDDSVLNVTQLTIKGSSPKDGSQQSRRLSQDNEVFASGMSVKTPGQSRGFERTPSQADLAAAESVAARGVKRGRTESKDLETAETGGASGIEDHASEQYHETYSPQLGQGALPNMLQTFGSAGSTKCISGQRTSMEATLLSKPRKSKKRIIQKSPAGAGDKCENEDSSFCKPCAPVSLGCPQKDSDKESTAEANNMGPRKDKSAANKSSLEGVKPSRGLHAGAAAGPEEQAGESPTSLRRSLRSHKSQY